MLAPLPPEPLHAPFDTSVRFPDDFVWGVATSSFQIEGAAVEDGKGESIWDRFCRIPGAIADASDGDIACDHYHRLEDDLDLIAELGVDAYRFSVSWPRVQPAGSGPWNPKGLAFYERLVDGLLSRGVKPFHAQPLGPAASPAGPGRLGGTRHRASLRGLCARHQRTPG